MSVEIGRVQSVRLQDILRVPRQENGRVKWTDMKNDPMKRNLITETLARRVYEQAKVLNQKTAKEFGEPSLLTGIELYYPGGLTAVRKSIGAEDPRRKPAGFWTIENIEVAAREFYDQHGRLTQPALKSYKMTGLESAITDRYPGGITGLQKNLEIGLSRRPVGEWTAGKVEEEARAYTEKGGKLTFKALYDAGRADLAGAISFHFPGRMTALKRELGQKVKTQGNEWTADKIKQEARAFIEGNGRLSHTVLRDKDRNDLSVAITRRYPGGIHQLKIDLGSEPRNRPNGYWTPEKIEEEAIAFYEKHGTLSPSFMSRNGEERLSVAIRGKYPGGMKGLRSKFEIYEENTDISKDEANAALDALFEGEKND